MNDPPWQNPQHLDLLTLSLVLTLALFCVKEEHLHLSTLQTSIIRVTYVIEAQSSAVNTIKPNA